MGGERAPSPERTPGRSKRGTAMYQVVSTFQLTGPPGSPPQPPTEVVCSQKPTINEAIDDLRAVATLGARIQATMAGFFVPLVKYNPLGGIGWTIRWVD